MSSSSPPWSLCTIIPDPSQAPRTCCHLPWHELVTPSTTQAPSPTLQRCRPRTILELATLSSSPSPRRCQPRTIPKPTMLSNHVFLGLTMPSSSLSPRCCHSCDDPEPVTPSTSRHPWAHNVIILPWACAVTEPTTLHCIFFYVILGQKILNLLHCFDMLHCNITFICYIATLLWYATHCYIAFVLLHSDIYGCRLHCTITKVD
jgi:hypothetical protein